MELLVPPDCVKPPIQESPMYSNSVVARLPAVIRTVPLPAALLPSESISHVSPAWVMVAVPPFMM